MSHVSSSTHGNSSESLPRPLKLTAFSRLPRFKEGCRYETQRTPFWQAWQNLCATLSVCLCVSEVLMTVLRGPSQHQICVFIPLWNTVSLWMLTIWCLLNHSSHPHQRASFLHLSRISKSVYIHYVYVRVLCVCKLCEFCQNLCVCLHVCDCACISVRAGWSLCVVAPNWGSDTAVLSLAFPSFSSLSAS